MEALHDRVAGMDKVVSGTLEELDELIRLETAAIAKEIEERLAPLIIARQAMGEAPAPACADDAPTRRPPGHGSALVTAALRSAPGGRLTRSQVDHVLTATGLSLGAARKVRERAADNGTIAYDGEGFVFAAGASPASPREHVPKTEAARRPEPVETRPRTEKELRSAEAAVLAALRRGPRTGPEIDNAIRTAGLTHAVAVQARMSLRESGAIVPDLGTGKWHLA